MLAALVMTFDPLLDEHLELPDWVSYPVATCRDIGEYLEVQCSGNPRAWIPLSIQGSPHCLRCRQRHEVERLCDSHHTQ